MDNTTKFEPWIFWQSVDVNTEQFYTVGDTFILDLPFFVWIASVDNDFQKANDSHLLCQWEDKQLQWRGGQRFQWPLRKPQ